MVFYKTGTISCLLEVLGKGSIVIFIRNVIKLQQEWFRFPCCHIIRKQKY